MNGIQLFRQVEVNGKTKAWLLGVQPESLRPGQGLSPAVQTTLELLRACLSRQHREGERPREPKCLLASEEIRAREDARPPIERFGERALASAATLTTEVMA